MKFILMVIAGSFQYRSLNLMRSQCELEGLSQGTSVEGLLSLDVLVRRREDDGYDAECGCLEGWWGKDEDWLLIRISALSLGCFT
jgi:hypothetical protein